MKQEIHVIPHLMRDPSKGVSTPKNNSCAQTCTKDGSRVKPGMTVSFLIST